MWIVTDARAMIAVRNGMPDGFSKFHNQKRMIKYDLTSFKTKANKNLNTILDRDTKILTWNFDKYTVIA